MKLSSSKQKYNNNTSGKDKIATIPYKQPLREKCPNTEFFWPILSGIWAEYGEIRTRKTPYLNTFYAVSTSGAPNTIKLVGASPVISSDVSANNATPNTNHLQTLSNNS